jgi:hypothetical protein
MDDSWTWYRHYARVRGVRYYEFGVGAGFGDWVGVGDGDGDICATTAGAEAGAEVPAASAGTSAAASRPASRVSEAALGRKLFGMMHLFCPNFSDEKRPTR